jgi:hypothetical protein
MPGFFVHEWDCGNVNCGLIIMAYALNANQIDFKTKLTHRKTDVQKLVIFGRATRPYHVRTRLFRQINMQKGRCAPPPNAHL